MLDGLVTALRTLSILPVPGRDAREFSRSLPWFPLVGLLLGVLLCAPAWLGSALGWERLGAALALVAGLVLTRGMHADGLADVADGFWGGRDPESALRIMKDPAVGSFGALALIALLLLKLVVLDRLVSAGAWLPIVSGVLLARLLQVLLAASLPYARQGGGTAGSFVAGAGMRHAALALLASLLLLLPLYLLLQERLALLAAAFLGALASGMAVGLLARRKIGGVTGDVLGAASEMAELSAWLAAALLLHT